MVFPFQVSLSAECFSSAHKPESCGIHGLDSLVRFLYPFLFFLSGCSSTAAISYDRFHLHTSLPSVVKVLMDGRSLLALCRFLVLAFLVLVLRISGSSNERYLLYYAGYLRVFQSPADSAQSLLRWIFVEVGLLTSGVRYVKHL